MVCILTPERIEKSESLYYYWCFSADPSLEEVLLVGTGEPSSHAIQMGQLD